ncbi:GatB/YqeY domain-containing protein [Alphaproteobacteria bacterium]|jgi:uncharacterized protein|nr:GatB/YqeY domain-containing protein [Alphaproteobacteria bacterium]
MLRDDLKSAMKDAMRNKRPVELSTIRLILAAIKDRDIANRSDGSREGVSDASIQELLQKMVKQRNESIKMYEQGGRLELAEAEQAEIVVIQGFLPEQMDEAAMVAAVDKAIADSGAASIKDMGKVMGALKSGNAGAMDMQAASALVKQRLAAK